MCQELDFEVHQTYEPRFSSSQSAVGLSPFREQLFDGDVGPQLSGEAREGVLLLDQLSIELQHIGLCLQRDIQVGL